MALSIYPERHIGTRVRVYARETSCGGTCDCESCDAEASHFLETYVTVDDRVSDAKTAKVCTECVRVTERIRSLLRVSEQVEIAMPYEGA
jgi:hypothetical protein